MMFFSSLNTKISDWLDSNNTNLSLTGFSSSTWPFAFSSILDCGENPLSKRSHIFVTPTIEEAEKVYNALKNRVPGYNLLAFPGLEISPYSKIVPSQSNLIKRMWSLQTIVHSNRPNIVICTFESFLMKIPPSKFFSTNSIILKEEDIFEPYELCAKLVELGYTRATSVEEAGTFSHKGEILDIFPLGGEPVRLHYFDELIEKIHPIDLETNKTKRDIEVKSVTIGPSHTIFSQEEFSLKLRENIPSFGLNQKKRHLYRKEVFHNLSDNVLFEEYPIFAPLFVDNPVSISDYFEKDQVLITQIESLNVNQAVEHLVESLREEYERDQEDIESDSIIPEPNKLYFNSLSECIKDKKSLLMNLISLEADFDEELSHHLDIKIEYSKTFLNRNVNSALPRHEYIKEVFAFLQKEFKYSGNIIFCLKNMNSKKEIASTIELYDFPKELTSRIHYINAYLEEGFFYNADKLLIISEGDLFSVKKSKIKKVTKKDIDLFAEQLSTLKEGDYVIHNEHGLGIYRGLESLEAGGTKADYLVIEYTSGDKIYVPVYKMNMIQKHADQTASMKPDSLRTKKFDQLKSKARSSVKKLAFDLLKLQAERQSAQAFAFSAPDNMYREFELSFPYEETPDQIGAIHDVIENMQKPVPMDHLVCGDVGFGKTEVAIRAAFKAVLDNKQVAILVPTTVLALQHYNSFKKRLKGFPVEIEFISRFKTPKEVKEIKEKLEAGKIDILIGTHKILGKTIKFKDLGMVVVDEEQRFGVNHKEKLKLLKTNVDFLTLTATPIPRTLQLAFLGIRELSLIRTAPPKRQSIKSYIIKEDDYTIKTAIEKELQRGGQVFIVHNRVQDMEAYVEHIQELVPHAKIVYAHGQMSEKELEEKIKAFYQGDYQVLISTTIIESGIDIPNANTMIVDRADKYGLAQLHQLRGRIGRSDRKAYAYFVVPGLHNLSSIAQKRLKALQTYAEMGAGFNIATADLEIRGAGDILGAEQSGHIERIGLELYMELLKEAIQELRGEKTIIKRDIEFQTPFASYIPNNYISDSGERLKIYKRLSNCSTIEETAQIKEELEDAYGLLNSELRCLFAIIESRIWLQGSGLKQIQVAGTLIKLTFDQDILAAEPELRDKIVNLFIARPKIYQITPDFKVICNHKEAVDENMLLAFAKHFHENVLA